MISKILCPLLLLLACVRMGVAQNTVAFYGVDFSMARTYGCDETAADFVKAFTGINSLFLSQPDKFDVSRFLGRRITDADIAVGMRSSEAVAFRDNPFFFQTLDKAGSCAPRIESAVAAYRLEQTEGEGVVIFADLLDKVSQRGGFHVVTFDLATRTIRSRVFVTGKPGGFGLRNYWAGALHRALKGYRKAASQTLENETKK